jgi:hypothetical protein
VDLTGTKYFFGGGIMKIKWDTSIKTLNICDIKLNLKKVALKDIRIFFLRSVYSKPSDIKTIESLKSAMKRGEPIPPILLEKHRGYYTIYDGNHRYYAALDLLGEKGSIYAWV